MNFLLSFEWLKEFVSLREKPEQLAQCFSLSGPSVERMRCVRDSLETMVVGKVRESKKHPNADRLTVNSVDVGMKMIQIICGAPNVKVGMLVAVALPGAKVRWHGKGDLVTLEKTNIRGVESFGMMCAANEIGLEKFPGEGIMDISFTNAKPGTPLAKALDIDDTLLDVEVTSNRPDMMSVVGLAREAAAVTGATLKFPISSDPIASPRQGRDNFQFPKLKSAAPLSVTVEAKDLCPRFAAIVIRDISVKPSPWWMQKRLLLAGLRPINNIVDITNYVLLEQGKPLHAFDGNKVHDRHLIVRKSKKG